MSHQNYFRLEVGMLDSLLRQWNGSEDANIMNFSKILLKFAIVLKFLNIVFHFRV